MKKLDIKITYGDLTLVYEGAEITLLKPVSVCVDYHDFGYEKYVVFNYALGNQKNFGKIEAGFRSLGLSLQIESKRKLFSPRYPNEFKFKLTLPRDTLVSLEERLE